jgi:hypothetical protein
MKNYVTIFFIFFVFAAVMCACQSESTPPSNTPTDSKGKDAILASLNSEKAAWETQGINGYYLTLTHAKGTAKYATKTLISDGSEPKFVETGSVGVTILTADFPFPPLAVTVPDIYKIAKDAASKGSTVEIRYDSKYHFPEYVRFGDDTITVKSLEPITKSDTLEADGFDFERHSKEKAAWEALNITSYRYTGELILGVPTEPVTITVTPDGTEVLESEETDEHWNYFYKEAISDIFDAIALNVKEDVLRMQNSKYTIKFRIEYDEKYHYPAYFISIECDTDGEPLDGSGGGVEITSFTKLK